MYGISNMFLQLTYDRISEFGNIENNNLALAGARGGDDRPWSLSTLQVYREVNKGLYVVARNFFLLLLNCSAWLFLGPA